MKKILLITVLAITITGSAVSCRKAVPINSPNFQVQAKSTAQVRKAIREVLKRRRWVIKSSGSNYFIARYDRGAKYSATVRIDFTSRSVKVNRVSSRGLLYATEDGEEVIHKTYNGWMRNLERDIELELSYM